MNDLIPNLEQVRIHAENHPYRLLFATVSGAHLYGFPSPDSDVDLRGVHVLPLEQLIGIEPGEATVDRTEMHAQLELDLVTHDVGKFVGLMLKRNGYVLEQLLSPLVVATTPEHEELKSLASACVTRQHAHHYLGFAASQWKLFRRDNPARAKPLLYIYRVLLTGIHLMRTGEVEANLRVLNEKFRLPYIDRLIEQKTSGPEKGQLASVDLSFHEAEYQRLRLDLEQAFESSKLPEFPSSKSALNDLLLRIRLGQPTS